MADKRENPQITCEIIQDLLPLYHDGVVSEKTGEAIKNHLEQCAACRKEYDMLCAELPIETSEPSTKNSLSIWYTAIRESSCLSQFYPLFWLV